MSAVVLGQFVGFAGRSVGSVIGGAGTVSNPWKFEFQSKDGGSSMVPVVQATDFFFGYLPLASSLVPAGFDPAGGDLVSFRPCEAKFQGFAVSYKEGIYKSDWLIFGWVSYTYYFAGEEYPDLTPYAVLVDPEDAGCYVLCNYQEITPLPTASA